MKTGPFNPNLLSESVFAVPPLARDADYQIDADENEKIIRFLEAGGVRSLLYGATPCSTTPAWLTLTTCSG